MDRIDPDNVAGQLAAIANDGGDPDTKARDEALDQALTRAAWLALTTATRASLRSQRAPPHELDDIAADAAVSYVAALRTTRIDPPRGSGYLRAVVRSTLIDSVRAEQRRPDLIDPSEVNEFSSDFDDTADDFTADYARNIWLRITGAAHRAGDTAADAILASAWDLAVTGSKVEKVEVARMSGYERTVVNVVLTYARTFVDEDHDTWQRPHR